MDVLQIFFIPSRHFGQDKVNACRPKTSQFIQIQIEAQTASNPVWLQNHIDLSEQVRQVKTIRLQFSIGLLNGLPKILMRAGRLQPSQRQYAIHILSIVKMGRGLGKTQRQRRPPKIVPRRV
jgi:hypothetical protein